MNTISRSDEIENNIWFSENLIEICEEGVKIDSISIKKE